MFSLRIAGKLLMQLHHYLLNLSGIERKGNGDKAIKRWMVEYLQAHEVSEEVAKAIAHFRWDKALMQRKITLDSIEFLMARLGLGVGEIAFEIYDMDERYGVADD